MYLYVCTTVVLLKQAAKQVKRTLLLRRVAAGEREIEGVQKALARLRKLWDGRAAMFEVLSLLALLVQKYKY